MQCTPCTDRGAGADALGQCLEKQLEGGLCSTGAAWKRHGGFTGSSDHASSGVTSHIQPCLHSQGVPKAHPLHPDGGLVWGTGEVWRLLIPRAKNVLLWRFSFQQSMEMCLSGNRV